MEHKRTILHACSSFQSKSTSIKRGSSAGVEDFKFLILDFRPWDLSLGIMTREETLGAESGMMSRHIEIDLEHINKPPTKWM